MSLNDIRIGLRAFLLSDPGISPLVDAARVYPVQLPQGQTLASIVYNRVSSVGDQFNEGASGLARPRIQIDCYARSADEASSLAAAVKQRLDGYRGSMGTVNVKGCFFDTEYDSYDGDAGLYRVRHDYIVWFDER